MTRPCKSAGPLAALRDYPRLSVTAWNEAIAHAIPEDAREWIRATVEVDNLELLADITAHTEGILITAYGNFDGDLVRLPIESTFLESLQSQIAFFTPRGRTLSPASSAVASILKEDATSRLFVSPNTPPVRGSAN
jgi:hypothetical protein